MLVIKARIHKMRVGIANREDPDQTASSEVSAVCLELFCSQTNVGNFIMFTVVCMCHMLYVLIH